MTKKSIFESVQKQTGVTPPEIEELVELPQPMELLWEWFLALSRRRGSTGFGILPLTYTEVWSWCQLTGNKLTPWELETLLDVDMIFLAEMAKEEK